jgi:hypothetical protein
MRAAFLRFRLDTFAAIVLVFLCALLLLSLQNPTSLDDGLRHFAMATLLREHGLFAVPGWSTFFYEGYMHTTPVDPWFLSDVLLIPFTYLPIAKGLQLFIVCDVAVLFTAFLLILRSLRLSARDSTIFLMLLVFGDTQFMGRFLLGRPYSLMTAMALFIIWSILQRRWILLSIVLVLSVLLSQLFVFPLFFCACALLAFLLAKHYGDALKLSAATIIGTICGFLLHPHPLFYLQYLLTAFLKIPSLKSIGLSREMHSGIFDGSFLSMLAVTATIILFAIRLHRQKVLFRVQKDPNVLFLFFSTAVLIVMFLLWVRAIDFLWPLLLISTARIYSVDRTAPHDLLQTLLPQHPQTTKILLWCCILACIVEVSVLPYLFVRDDASHTLAPYHTLSVLPTGSKVLNLDWDKFFVYVAARPDLTYASGIDRSFTYLTDPSISDAIYGLEQATENGKTIPDLQKTINTILSVYRSDYLIVSYAKFGPVIHVLQKNPAFGLLSDNGVIAIYAVPDWYRPLP